MVRRFLRFGNGVVELLPDRLRIRGLQIAIDCGLASISVWLSYQFRFDFATPILYASGMWFWVAAMPLIRPLALIMATGYRSIWRFIRVQELAVLACASVIPSLLLLSLRLSVGRASWITSIPRGVIFLELLLFVGFAASVRALRRAAYEERGALANPRQPTLLIGGEQNLAAVLAQFRTFPEMEVVGLVASGAHLRGRSIAGVPVVGELGELASLLRKREIKCVVIADAKPSALQEITALATHLGIEARRWPSAARVVRGEVRIADVFDPNQAIERQHLSASPDPSVLEVYRHSTVLVTGAGGSIGAEICRQLCVLEVSTLLLLDNDENSIFEIENDLRTAGAQARFVPIVGDIRNSHLLRHVFERHRPHIVLHAAAYKHVPIMETNSSEAVLNNVMGTRNLADAAIEFGCQRFLLVSSDKAVRPANVMGATKRIAELLVQNRARSSRITKFAGVRFGNVVGSRGSVIPMFLSQIASGGALSITDERMSRYFMTLKEAVHLVLQASALAANGEIYVLEMGAPVTIASLARKLIEMSGLSPERDVSIETTGIRAGEKLQEMLCEEHSRLVATKFARIYAVKDASTPADVETSISELEDLATKRQDAEVLNKLRSMPIGYGERSHA